MLVTEKSSEVYAKRQAGGKGYNLFILTQEGFPVPPWVVLPASLFEQFKSESGIGALIQSHLHLLNLNPRPADTQKTASQIHNLILGAELSPAVRETIVRAIQHIQTENIPLAVRSSALDEDSSHLSFAGQLSTYLYVRTESEILTAVKECWASGFSERGLSYRIQNNVDLQKTIRVGIVLQHMVDSEKSGVIFTCDPISSDPHKMMINSVYGIGEGLVSGQLDADTFVVQKDTGAVLQSEIVEKKEKWVQSKVSAGTQELAVAPEDQNSPSLSTSELATLTELAKRVEKHYRYPQDIEWGFSGGRLYLLQSRPVTTEVQNADGLLYIWDNSNIVESYGGITLPLTFSFAHHVYHWVYIQFCEILWIPQNEIRKMDYFLRNMLGLISGRVYYNILNWYKLTSILPGFKYNRSFMETMMGTSHELADEIADRIKPPGFHEKWTSKLRRMVTGLKFLYFHLTIQKMVDRYLEYFHLVYSEYRHLNYFKMTSDEIYRHYQDLEQKLLMKWHAPIVNDYLCMVHFGLLKKLSGSWLKSLGPSIQNDLLCGEGKLESAEPTRELIRMAASLDSQPELKSLLENIDSSDCFEVLKQSRYTDFFARVERYIDLYGFRCMNEMKLEEIDLYQDPTFLFVCLKNYLRTGQTDLEAYEIREKKIRAEAEAKVSSLLRGWKKSVFNWSLKNARTAVKNRENTRFCRTRIYGVVRAMFHGIGRDFTLRKMIERPEDLFYLELKELAGALEGTLTIQNIGQLISLRKSEYQGYQAADPPPRFMTRGPVYWMNKPVEPEIIDENPVTLEAHQMKGIGCCPGIVEGVVKVILSPQDNMALNKEILVTQRTDPGWIPLYPSASALLVERGGLLSHSAIVAREMGLPTVVGVKGLTQRLKTGMRVRINGETGMVDILEAGDSA